MSSSSPALTFHCILLLIHTHRHLNLNHGFLKIDSFGNLSLAIVDPSNSVTIDAMIVLSQADICIGYLNFISNIPAYLFHLSSNPSPFLAPKALTLLSPLSIFANGIDLSTIVNVVDLSTMSIILGEILTIFLTYSPPLHAFIGPFVLLYGISITIYTFEGITMVLSWRPRPVTRSNLVGPSGSPCSSLPLSTVIEMMGGEVEGKGHGDVASGRKGFHDVGKGLEGNEERGGEGEDKERGGEGEDGE